MNTVGKRYRCSNCGTVVIVSRGGQGQMECCEISMEQQDPRDPTSIARQPERQGTDLGKRVQCVVCGTEGIIAMSGLGSDLRCDDEAMVPAEVRQIASAD